MPRPGSYTTGFAGSQPVLVVRDDEHGLRAYRNVCRHRGSCLLSGAGQCKGAIRCRYHGWTYKFDGTLIGVPEGRQFGDERLEPLLAEHGRTLHPKELVALMHREAEAWSPALNDDVVILALRRCA